ncbi:peregrin isoform X3 [Hermetia illucens]|uniref:peregrin isoform X3 n=1 Tax=Hermetia illucens TaxID=343691 RepID=UPI0018CC729B|nr:peregrin isoform X3 [Hermetia illucens]
MGLDFDPLEYCKKLKNQQHSPPYSCPVDKCDRSYKSVCGLQYHLVNYDHNNPQPVQALVTPNRKKGRSRIIASPSTPVDAKTSPKEAVTYCEAENFVQFDIDGKSIKVNAGEDLPIISSEDYHKMLERGDFGPTPEVPPEPHLKLPVAAFNEIEGYNICDAPARPNAYIRFIEKSAEELDGEVEYDVDEEDTTWLATMNHKREEAGMNPVGIDTLELLMDRLEKESYFQAAANGQSGVEVDDDAVCCICMDGECQNTNVILFCDMCNLAVHQDCYGVPYIPEGQWLCRRCLQSPSTPVSCVLCPNTGGAFKQTDRGLWAHVVCALWIPEVRFANTVFLEPIDSIEMIPPARWRLTCYVCKEKGIGACIQCLRNNCYAAFHVTCAQQAGLYMRMDTVKDSGNEAHPVQVQKIAYCHTHTPADAKNDSDFEKAREETRHKMKEARKLLAKKRSSVPLILIPTIPTDRVQEISGLVSMQKKAQFIQRLIAYWTLKRQYRNGVPLLRRLQSQGQSHSSFGRNGIEGSPNSSELYQHKKKWQCLRQDLERARLLCELVRKREKLKAALIKTTEQVLMLQLNPLETAMSKLLDMLEAKDTSEIFMEPVNCEDVPDYRDIVKHPMDLGTMRQKLKDGKYRSLDEMEFDFDLMIKNCLAYNNKDTVFYRAGIRMRDQGGPLFKVIRKELEREGIVDQTQTKSDDNIVQEIDDEYKELTSLPPNDALVEKLLILSDKAQALRNPTQRTKRVKIIRLEMSRVRKALTRAKIAASKAISDSSQSDAETKEQEPVDQTPPCSPLKSICNSASPSGVNRRTAVLFTRKAQAVLKKPEQTAKEESSCEMATLEKVKSPKRNSKNKRPSNRRSIEDGESQRDKHRSPTSSPKKSPHKENFESIPDSFRLYRANPNREISETDESESEYTDSPCSSCSEFSVSGSGSDFDSSFEEDGSGNNSDMVSNGEQHAHEGLKANPPPHDETTTASTPQPKDDKGALEPLQLVWAKCRGYPWYPALIIDPKTPKGFVYNGVPLPAPPQDVLNLRKNYTEDVFLVLFFDAKRTWQWLPSTKLELLGIDKELDQSKLVESRKPTDRKAVKKAYQDALHYQSQHF